MAHRTTIVIPDPLAARRLRAHHARVGILGARIVTLPGLAARLAGGLLRSVTTADLQRALRDLPAEGLGSLAEIASLPGFPRAASSTLQHTWSAAIDLQREAAAPGAHPRWQELRALEAHAALRLPTAALPPPALVAAAEERMQHARTAVGDVRLEHLAEVAPIYRPLLIALAQRVDVGWAGLPGAERPAWLPDAVRWLAADTAAEPAATHVTHVSCADPTHEVVEALRWARRLLAEGHGPAELGLAAASVAEHDDALYALLEETQLPIHAAHGLRAVATGDGQRAAALGDLLVRGLEQTRVRRAVSSIRHLPSSPLAALPDDWAARIPVDAALNDLARWRRAIHDAAAEDWPGGPDAAALLARFVEDVAAGPAQAEGIGERWLGGRALALWRRALAEGPPAAIDVSLSHLRLGDGVDPSAAIVWAPARYLAASPRPFVRLLGLASRSWPRRAAEDPLLPAHVLGDRRLHERSRPERDRADFTALLAGTPGSVVLSRPRRGTDGRRLAASPLVRPYALDVELRPRAPTTHAMSEADRRASRPGELANDPWLVAARGAWRAWHRPELTPHDGVVRAHHPAVIRALARVHSATSLRRLLRDPLGFVFHYVHGWRSPVLTAEPLALPPAEAGELLHRVLEAAVRGLESTCGFASADAGACDRAIEAALQQVAHAWEIERPIPPPVLWHAELAHTRALASSSLSAALPPLPAHQTFVEVPFGRGEVGAVATADDARPQPSAKRASAVASPWPTDARVVVPATDIEVSGVIDRLDLSIDRSTARVIDYKSGRTKPPAGIDGGKELQRALYASAVHSLLGPRVQIRAYLLHARSRTAVELDDPEGTLQRLASAATLARELLRAGNAIPGVDAFDEYADHLLALPADRTSYQEIKGAALGEGRSRVLETLEPRA
jgi:RecB family exonuclease